MVRDTARAYCKDKLAPRVLESFRHERTDASIFKELGLPIKFVGLGEQPDDLQPFAAKQFAEALFSAKE